MALSFGTQFELWLRQQIRDGYCGVGGGKGARESEGLRLWDDRYELLWPVEVTGSRYTSTQCSARLTIQYSRMPARA